MNAIEREILKQLEKRVEKIWIKTERFFKEKMGDVEEHRRRKEGVADRLGKTTQRRERRRNGSSSMWMKKKNEKKNEKKKKTTTKKRERGKETDLDEDFSAWDVELPTDEDGKIDRRKWARCQFRCNSR